MASNEKPRSGLSLYANLLNKDAPNTGATISSAPVTYKQPSSDTAKEDEAKKNAALRFQPTKRPQLPQKSKPKPSIPKSQSSLPETSSPGPDVKAAAAQPAPPPPQPQQPRATLADWTADDDDINGFYAGEKRQRGGRKKRKKNKEEAVVAQDWDDIYDPTRPNNYEDYKHSEERIREIREWKDKLYRHRMKKRRGSSEMSEDERPMNKSFAPPNSYSFAPPPALDSGSPIKQATPSSEPLVPAPPSEPEDHYAAPPPPTVPPESEDTTGEDVYARRMRMSGMAQAAPPPPPTSSDPPPPPPSSEGPPPPPPTEQVKKPAPPGAVISSAPVRYSMPAPPADLPKTDEELEAAIAEADAQEDNDQAGAEQPRSNRPGQKGFAERLMSKYGWTKGSGLGAEGTGIVNPLRVQVEKRKKKSDAEGGGWFGPSGKGVIVGSKAGGKKKGGNGQAEEDGGKQQMRLSEVVVLRGMVDGLDLRKELSEGNLMEEIGTECGDKYGRVERVFIDQNSTAASIPVFIKFTSQLSGLRAVQALQGRVFNGNTVEAGFYDVEQFDEGIYE